MARTLHERFEAVNDEYIKFENIENPPTNRADLCAFLLLDKLVPSERPNDIVLCSEHDEIWLDIDAEKLNAVATDDDILFLTRCGVGYDSDRDALSMFV